MASYTSKRISELQEATKLSDNDLFVINEYSHQTGYTLTKKVLSRVLYEYVYGYVSSRLSTLAYYQLSDLAYCDIPKMLTKMMEINGTPGLLSSDSLALSAKSDLNLGDMMSLNLEDLHLEQYVVKNEATCNFEAASDEYVRSIQQHSGKIVDVKTGKFSTVMPIDENIDGNSANAVRNAAIKEALDKKLDIVGTDYDYWPVDKQYIAGIHQKNGKIAQVDVCNIPENPIDSNFDEMSEHPLQNKVITAKLNELHNNILQTVNENYVNKNYANSYWEAENNAYIYAIKQENGKITNVQQRSLSSIISDYENRINSLKTYIDNSIANLRNEIESNYLKLNNNAQQTVSGPVKFNQTISGNITNADYAIKANWA